MRGVWPIPPCLCHPSFLPSHCPILLCARQESVSQHLGPNPLFEVPSSSFALLMLAYPSPVFLPIWPSYLSAGLLPACCSCNQGHRYLHCPPLPWPPASAARPDHTCHLHMTQSPGTLATGAFIHLALQGLSSPHPCTLSLRNGWCRAPWQSRTQCGCCEDASFRKGQRELTQGVCVWGWVFSLDSSHISSFQWHPFMAT